MTLFCLQLALQGLLTEQKKNMKNVPCRALLTEQKRNMSCTALRELLIRELGQKDAIRFSDVHIQNLIDKGYTDHGALKDATRDGLQSPPPLLPALVDKLLKCFKPAGNFL